MSALPSCSLSAVCTIRALLESEDDDTSLLKNVGNLLPVHTMQHPRIPNCLTKPPKESQICHSSDLW